MVTTRAHGLDYNGNTLTKVVGSNTTTYAWDFENRLTTVTLPGSGGSVSFKYDPFGRRIYKSSSASTSIYAYDGDNLIEETNSSGTAVARYSDGLNIDEPLAMLRSSATSFYDADGLGTITSLANTTGSLAQTYTFDSFGNQTASSGSLTNPFQYTARENDPETGLYYYRARYYDPAAGHFISEDPVGFDLGGVNFYAYVENDPAALVDPLGLVFCVYKVSHHYLVCISDDGKRWFDTILIRSGCGPDCVNNKACEPKPGGPIPEGGWTFGQIGDTPPHKGPQRIPIWPKAGTNDYGRSPGFQAHLGVNIKSSNGCLAINDPDYHRFLNFFAGDNGGSLSVRP